MKKFFSKDASKTISSATLWAVTFFAIFGMALLAYAVTYPDTQPGPASGNVGMFVGGTLNTYTGGQVSGYQNVNNLCLADFDYSHACTEMEMINTYNHEPSAFNGDTSTYWINVGSPGNVATVSNDCRGWTSSSSAHLGYVWNLQSGQSNMTPCDLSWQYACCK